VTPDSVVLLAGFVLAHAAWSVSDLPKGELLVPLAVVETGGKRQLLRFEAQTQEQSIAEAKATLSSSPRRAPRPKQPLAGDSVQRSLAPAFRRA